jgi:hypothetical protein
MDLRQLDEQYFEWLYKQVADPDIEEPSLTNRGLLNLFFRTEFIWVAGVRKDEKRIKDGKALRYEFLRSGEAPVGVPPEWMNYGCSVLELMIGLARRIVDMAEGEPPYWFWLMTENIGLRHYTDDVVIDTGDVEETLNRVIFRRYHYDGKGGFFPLEYPDKDQRNVELWYQASAYVLEHEE